MPTTKIREMQFRPQRGNANVSKTSQRESLFTSTLNPLTGKVIKARSAGKQLSDESNVPAVLSLDARATLLQAHKEAYIAATFRLAHYSLSTKERKSHEKLLRIYAKRIARLS